MRTTGSREALILAPAPPSAATNGVDARIWLDSPPIAWLAASLEGLDQRATAPRQRLSLCP